MPFGTQNDPKGLPKWCQILTQMLGSFVFVFMQFLVAFPVARPSILLFTVLSWGAAFFAESEKGTSMTPQNEAKWIPKSLRRLNNRSKNQARK